MSSRAILSRERELLRLLAAYEARLLEAGVPLEELESLKASSARPGEHEEKDEVSSGDHQRKPLYRHHSFVTGTKDVDVEELAKTVGEFQSKYFNMPSVEVRYKEVSYSATVDLSKPEIQTVGNSNPLGAAIRGALIKVKAKREGKALKVERTILQDVTGLMLPKTMTLVIGAPGCGKTSYLKLLCGLLKKKTSSTQLKYTECSYNGEDIYAPKRSFVPSKLCVYIDQIDKHVPTLTVDDTMKFAFKTYSAGDALGTTEKKDELFETIRQTSKGKSSSRKKDEVVKMIRKGGVNETEAAEIDKFIASASLRKLRSIQKILGIDHVKDTIVGNAAVRGVSGGQRRRVSIGEMLMGKCRLIAGDEITTGLDAQTTFEIARAMRAFAKHVGITVVLSLLQPPPEAFNLFDKVVVLHRGCVAYHGPVDKVLNHFARPELLLIPPQRKDVADFLVEVTSSDELAREYCQKSTEGGQIPPSRDYAKVFKEVSEFHKAMCDEIASKIEEKKTDDHPYEWGHYYSIEFTESTLYYLKIMLWRNMLELKYSPTYLKSRFGQAFVMGIFTGTLFYNVEYDEFATKFGLIFASVMFVALSGMSAIPSLVEHRTVFYKQRDSAFYPTSAYVLANVVKNVTIIALEVLMYCNLVFWPAGLAHEGFYVYLLGCFLVSLAMAQWFAAIAAAMPDAQAAQPLAGMSVLLSVLFSGFIIQKENVPPGWIWLYWVSPISLTFRTIAIAEFRSDRYEKCTYQRDEVERCSDEDPCCEENDDGIWMLKAYSVQTETIYILIGLLVLSGYWLFSCFLETIFLTYIRHSGVGGGGLPLLVNEEEEFVDPDNETKKFDAARLSEVEARKASEEPSEIPYEPTTLAFEDLHYSVQVPSKIPHGPSEWLELLGGVTGFAAPATLTALMGSSGAGKTTLLDVVACRKTSGRITGSVTLNGFSADAATFSRISGYVEQLDVHNPGPTVMEAVDFSASLRLPKEHATKKKAFVSKILSLLELAPIANSQTGTIDTGGLSFEQRKRLTMAVELAANPAILFLDEPTSGLDSRAALVVMRATRNIAATGRSVICTIHQPSYALFSVFDRLLLLKRGGQTVYFGDLGAECATMREYFETTCSLLQPSDMPHTLPSGANPATWMLSTCVSKDADFASAYAQSSLAEENLRLTRRAMEPPDGYTPPEFHSRYAVSVFPQQFTVLLKRLLISYWRGPAYNVARGMVSIIVALIFGSCYTKERSEAIDTYSEVLGRVGLFFLAAFFMGIIFFSAALQQMAIERESYYREKAAGMYHPLPYTISFGVAETPYLIVFAFLHTALLWAVVDFYPGPDRFFFYYVYYLLYISFATFYAQFLVAALPDEGTAQTIGTALLTLSSLVGGFTITPDNIPDYWKVIYWLAPIHYTLEGTVVTQFHGADKNIDDVPRNPTVGRFTSSHWSDSHFGGEFTWSHRFQNIIILVIICGVFRVGTLYALTFIDYTTR